MHLNEVNAYRQDKDHLMRHEGKHPANYSREEKAPQVKPEHETMKETY